MSPCSFWHTKQFCHIFTPVDQLLCSILHKNGPTTYNEHLTAYNIMALVCAGWLHEVQWVLCTAFWSMDMTGVYACLFEAVCDVTTVPSHLKLATTPVQVLTANVHLPVRTCTRAKTWSRASGFRASASVFFFFFFFFLEGACPSFFFRVGAWGCASKKATKNQMEGREKRSN